MLIATIIAWVTSLWMSPHGETVADGTGHVRTVVTTFVRKSAIGTLMLSALSAWLLFPQPRPRAPRRDWAIITVLAVMVATSIYQLFWIRSLLN